MLSQYSAQTYNMTPQKKRKQSPSRPESAKKQNGTPGSSKKKHRRSTEHDPEDVGKSSAEKFQKKVKKQHEATKGKEPENNEEDDFAIVQNQKLLIDAGHHGPKKARKKDKKVSGSGVSIDGWFTDTPWSQVKPQVPHEEEEAHEEAGAGHEEEADEVETGAGVEEEEAADGEEENAGATDGEEEAEDEEAHEEEAADGEEEEAGAGNEDEEDEEAHEEEAADGEEEEAGAGNEDEEEEEAGAGLQEEEAGAGNEDEEEEEAGDGEEEEADILVTPVKKHKIFQSGGKGKKPCKGGCGKFVPAVSKYEICVTSGDPITHMEIPPSTQKVYKEPGRGRKACKGACGKFIPSVSKNETCVSTGEAIKASDVAEVVHAFSKSPGSAKVDIGKRIKGANKHEPGSTVTDRKGERTCQTLVVPVYDEMDDDGVKKKVATLDIGNLVDSKKKAYAMTYTMDGASVVKTILADELEKYAEDAMLYKTYGHVTEWIGHMEDEKIVLMEEMSDPIVNAYWTDISLFSSKKTIEIGGFEVESVEKVDSHVKLRVGGWKKDDSGLQVAVSGRIFAFGEEDGKVDLDMIIYTPIIMLVDYDAFREKFKKLKMFTALMASVDKGTFTKNPKGLEMLRYSQMKNGWVCKENLKDYLKVVLKNANAD